MTKTELCTVSGLKSTHLDQLLRDEVIPPSFWTKSGGRAGKEVNLAPIAVAVVELLKILTAALGETSSAPKTIVRSAIPTIERMWHNPQLEAGHNMTITVGDLEMTVRPSFVEKAKKLVAA